MTEEGFKAGAERNCRRDAPELVPRRNRKFRSPFTRKHLPYRASRALKLAALAPGNSFEALLLL